MDTVASNPGHVSLNRWHWFRHRPFWPSIWLILVTLCCVAYAVHHWAWVIPAMLLALPMQLYLSFVEEHFHFGDANPGLVVSTSPLLIAVRTDLTKGAGSYPVIKVSHERSTLGEVQVGSRVATVALYNDTKANVPYWAGFNPIPVNCATGDQAEIDALMATFDESDWQALVDGLRNVPHTRGIYPLGWEDAEATLIQ